MEDLSGKTAVVTGAASGIGLALSERLGVAGCSVVLADVDERSLERAVRRVESSGASALGVITDVTCESDIHALRDRALERFGAPHLVFANAGVESGGRFVEIPPEAWRWVLDVNLLGVVRTIQAFLPGLVAHGASHVVITASQASVAPWTPTFAPYGAAKAGVAALAENLHQEMTRDSPHVGVTLLVPGVTRTRMIDSERNRPEGVPASTSMGERESIYRALARRTAEVGMNPFDVADIALEAVRDRRFWASADPEATYQALTNRLRWFLEGTPPAQRAAGD